MEYLKLKKIYIVLLCFVSIFYSVNYLQAQEATSTINNNNQVVDDTISVDSSDSTTSKPIKYLLPNSVLKSTYVGMPQVLDDYDLKLYYQIFKLQYQGRFKEADLKIKKLHNDVLLGYVYYNRYESKSYRSRPSELRKWLYKYHTLPVAIDIYKLLQLKTGERRPRHAYRPQVVGGVSPIYVGSLGDDLNINMQNADVNFNSIAKVRPRRTHLTRRLDILLRRGKSLAVKNTLYLRKTKRSLGRKYYSYYAGQLAKTYFLNGRDAFSKEWGQKALKWYPQYFPGVNMCLGLVAWREKDYATAKKYFDFVVKHKSLYKGKTISKAAYWAARANLKLKNFDGYYKNLQVASNYDYSFYGILASEELGSPPNYSNKYLNVSGDNIKQLLSNQHGKRALALLQFGLSDWAGQELLLLIKYDLHRMPEKARLSYFEGIIYLNTKMLMPMLSYTLAGANGKYYGLNSLSYPIFNVNSKNPDIDPLLTLAVIRTESNFNSMAKSNAGAVGLMQLMPSTAKVVMKTLSAKYKTINYYPNVRHLLLNPIYNANLGQEYFKLILDNAADNNLIYALAGWNGGSLYVKKWRKQKFREDDDQLFFIESIPFKQTREFVKKVLTDYWVYQLTVGVIPKTAFSLIAKEKVQYIAPSSMYINNVANFNYTLGTDSTEGSGNIEQVNNGYNLQIINDAVTAHSVNAEKKVDKPVYNKNNVKSN